MLGSLSLMACTLLLAAVPSLSSSLQPREEVNLPAIGYVMADDVRAGICPVGAGDTAPCDLTASTGINIHAYFGDDDVYSQNVNIVDNYVLLSYESSVLTLDVTEDLDIASVIFISIPYNVSAVSVYLPDLSYWDLGDLGYYTLLVFGEEDGFYSVYGNTVTSTDSGQVLSYTLAELGEDVNPVGAIGDGLGVIGALGGALSSGFDGVFLDNGVLTSVGTFSFVLLGLGISVGIVKKCFNWVTGRHGM